jgi:hypothetical protein
MRYASLILSGTTERDRKLDRPSRNGKIILKWILQKFNVKMQTAFKSLRLACAYVDEPSGSIKHCGFIY